MKWKFFLEFQLDTDIPVWTFFANSKIFRSYTILQDSAGSMKFGTKKDLDIVMLHLVFPFSFCWSRDWIVLRFNVKTFASSVYAWFDC